MSACIIQDSVKRSNVSDLRLSRTLSRVLKCFVSTCIIQGSLSSVEMFQICAYPELSLECWNVSYPHVSPRTLASVDMFQICTYPGLLSEVLTCFRSVLIIKKSFMFWNVPDLRVSLRTLSRVDIFQICAYRPGLSHVLKFFRSARIVQDSLKCWNVSDLRVSSRIPSMLKCFRSVTVKRKKVQIPAVLLCQKRCQIQTEHADPQIKGLTSQCSGSCNNSVSVHWDRVEPAIPKQELQMHIHSLQRRFHDLERYLSNFKNQ
jgi:hypothetical protein